MKKEDNLNQSGKTPNFWFCAGLLAVLVASIGVRGMTRPFYGLHSWAEASGAWAARSHVKYGLGYTKGVSTWAVGDPPTQAPKRYLDHPQLGGLINAAIMAVFGINEWSRRAVSLIPCIITLMLFLRILRGLLDERRALLAGLILVLFPLSCYFGIGGWFNVLSFLALYCYLVLIQALNDGPQPQTKHKVILAICLFFMVQLTWSGFFYAFTIGSHYLLHCIRRKKFPQINLLAILAVAPLASLLFVFIIMAAGYDWDINRIIELYKWRAGKGELREFVWSVWFAKIWEFGATNFTVPVLITAILYMTLGQLIVLTGNTPEKKVYFPQLYLFLMPGVYKLLALKGMVWRHQYYQRAFAPFLAIAVALAVMLLADLLKKINRRLSIAVPLVLLAVLFGFCMVGTNFYYSIRWQAPAKIRMFKMLNQSIPPDKALLSYESFIVNQHKSKGAFYRPEIAWYLDREIVQARTPTQIQQQAKTGRFPYYLMPTTHYNKQEAARLAKLGNELRRRYKMYDVPGDPGERTKDGKFIKAGMNSYMIFDLKTKASN